jgi:hypothetical protein
MTEKESPFACDMTAIAPDERDSHLAVIVSLFRSVEDLREQPNGYSFRLPNESAILLTVARFIMLERLCCPFLGFGVDVEREGGAVWLTLTGRDGVKPFIIAEIGEHLPSTVQESLREQK